MNHVAVHSSLNLLSLCTGGAGLDLGIELAIPGARTVCMVEREAFAVAHLVAAMEQGLLHQAPVWSDARTFDGRPWRGAVDGLIGGIPCQGHSLAGKKRGSLDERDLWSPARRIVVQARPWFVLIENVGGMLSPGDDEIAGAERVWRDLRKLGFAVEGGLFTAAEVGASHERERIFILAVVADSDGLSAESVWRDRRRAGEGERQELERRGIGLADAFREGLEGSERRTARSRDEGRAAERDSQGMAGVDLVDASRNGRREGWAEPVLRSGQYSASSTSRGHDGLYRREHLADTDGHEPAAQRRDAGEMSRRAQGEGGTEHGAALPGRRGLPDFPPGPGDLAGWRAVLERAPELEPAVRRMADGLAGRVDRLRMLGNGVVPLQAAYAVRTLATRLAERGSAGAARLVRMMVETS